MVLEPLTAHSKLLLSAHGVELEVHNCAYFKDAMGPRVMIPEPVSTHSKLLLSEQGVELVVQFCE